MSSHEPPPRLWHRERIRLDLATYATSGQTWLVTITTLNRQHGHLAPPDMAEAIIATLQTAHDLNSCHLLAYCVMPDHLHTVTHVSESGDLVKLINGFKSFSTRAWWELGGGGTLWQRSFHDRGLRTVKDIEAAVVYVRDNPIRAGIVESAESYPYVGGELFKET